MSQEPLISVLVPAYNAEAFMEQCLESIVAQTYRHLEIIVVDDGSTDGTATISDRWAERDDRITQHGAGCHDGRAGDHGGQR